MIDISLCQLTPLACQVAPTVGKDVADSAANAFFGVMTSGLSLAASWMVGHLVALIDVPSPDLTQAWYRVERGQMQLIAGVAIAPVLMIATIGAALRQDVKRLGRIWGVGLPVAVLAGIGGAAVVGLGLQLTDRLSAFVTPGHSSSVTGQLAAAVTAVATSDAPPFVRMLMLSLMILGSLLIWLELLVRTSAIYLAVFFMPLALVGYIWPATSQLARRVVEVITALVLSKFVIVAALALGEAALRSGAGPGPMDGAITGSAILLIASFAPFSLLRLAPVVEAAAIAHLEGLSRRPVKAAASAAFTAMPAARVAMAVASRTPDGQGVGSMAVTGADPSPARPVAAVSLPERPPDYPIPAGRPPGDG